MNDMELHNFMNYCDDLSDSFNYAYWVDSDPNWPEQRKALYFWGIIPGLYHEGNPSLRSLINQPCDHNKLIPLLVRVKEEYENSELAILAKKRGYYNPVPDVSEPLIDWIANHNCMLAAPLVESKEELLAYEFPEQILSYVYISLTYSYKRQQRTINRTYDFDQPKTENLYEKIFDKSSVFKSWGLLPIDNNRKLYAFDDPVRLYDSKLDVTIFLRISRPLAMVLDELYEKHLLHSMAFRTSDTYIYQGENHESVLQEAVEKGKTFSWDLMELPSITRLYNEQIYEDCLWIKVDGSDITFEELCEDFHDDGNCIVTQMVHLQYKGNNIVHIDHEFIFYDLESYEKRIADACVKGQAKKRIKTFKVDKSMIPMDYPCQMFKGNQEIFVPFIFFVLFNYFEHKDLLEEYFKQVL